MEEEKETNQQEEAPAEEEAKKEAVESTEAPETGEKTEEIVREGEPVFCKNCQKKVEPIFKNGRWKCPECHLFVGAPKSKTVNSKGGQLGIGEVKKGKDVRLTSARYVSLGGSELANAESLINAGFAENFNDLIRKSLELVGQQIHSPYAQQQLNLNNQNGEQMKQEEPNPGRALKQIQEGELIQAQIDKMKKGGSMENTGEIIDKSLRQQLLQAQIESMKGKASGNSTDPITTMMLMRYMENAEKGKDHKGNGFMDKLMEIQLMKSIGGNQNNNEPLMREIADLKHNMVMQQVLQQSQQKGVPTLNDQLMAMEKIRGDRDVKIKEAELDAQKSRDKTLGIAIGSKLKEMEKAIDEARQSGGGFSGQRIKDLKEEISAVKEMSNILGDREKSAGEYISETIGNVAQQIQPALTNYMQQKEEQKVEQQMAQQQVAEQAQQPQEESAPAQSEGKSSMTLSEQEMSQRMQEMYL